MRREIEMPRLSDSVDEGVLVTWLVESGAPVKQGDLLAEIQVEKTSSEVRAPATGRIVGLLFGAGDVVRQGAAIAVLETDEQGEVDVARAQVGVPPAEVAVLAAPREIIASPAARRLARELGVDLGLVAGSGPGGRIVEADVQAATTASTTAATATTTAAARPSAGIGSSAADAAAPLSPMRRTIADRLRAGLAATAQLTLTAEADVTELEARLRGWSAAWGRRASWTEALVRACALALGEHPRLATRLTDRGLARPERIDIGVAIALDDGLVVPAVRDADRKDIATLGREIADLADRARSGTLAPAETQGACFSVTNLGAYRIDAFTPLLDPPQTAILGAGRARSRPAVVDGAVVPRTLLVLSLTFDHQVVDGAPAAAFLQSVVDLLEAPERL